MPPYPKIQDHGIIGDCRSAALVSRFGAINWLCWPRFDSPSVFASLLDARKGGEWSIAPSGEFRSHQSYLEGTNVLETHFSAETGECILTDGMPALDEEDKRKQLLPEGLIFRRLLGLVGEVGVEMRFQPRPDYGKSRIRIRPVAGKGYRLDAGHESLFLACGAADRVEEGEISLRFRIRAGESRYFLLSFDTQSPGVWLPGDDRVETLLQASVRWWRAWSGTLRYQGPWREPVRRSALVLKLLQYAPTGAVVAAPTTSLPEKPGGSLNWDYRFCWLRDSSLTIRALLGLGCRDEGEAFIGWLLNSIWITQPRIRVLYDLFGERRGTFERELPDWEGYRGSRPVRLGNQAGRQFQLDLYGEVLGAVALLQDGQGELDRETRKMLVGFGKFVCRHWREPDNGIWEVRQERRRFTHSMVLCWATLDQLLRMHERGLLPDMPGKLFRENRSLLEREIREKCWNPGLGSYTRTMGGDDLDSSLLRLSWHGFENESSERMRATCAALRRRLEPKPGLLYRYEPSLKNGEGAFGICGFWLAEFLARGGGSPEEAREVFSSCLAHANGLGLFAEEIDPATGDSLGNFPQAFTHVGLINAALSLGHGAGS